MPAQHQPNYSSATRAHAMLDRRAEKDAMKAIARDIPDPDDYARLMPLSLVTALLTAWNHRTYGWAVTREVAPYLRPLGLVAYNGCGLTVFGYQVMLVLRRQDA